MGRKTHKITTDQLNDVIQQELELMQQNAVEAINKASETAAKDAVKELKSNSPKRSKEYSKSWKTLKEKGASGVIAYTIYNTKGWLTHLLEHGHLNRDGTRTPGIPHIGPVENKLNKELQKEFIKEYTRK